MANIRYIADHIDRIEGRHGGDERLILDSKWRIASSADLFDDELDPKGSLTHEQVKQVDSYIAKFKGGQS